VFIVGLEQGGLPLARAEEEGRDLEEERRLCFVGITRAKSRLTLLHARYRMQRGQTNRQMPSVFLREIGDVGVERQSLARFSSSAPVFGVRRDSRREVGTTRRYPAPRQPAAAARTAQADREEEARLRAALPQDESPYKPNQLVKHPTYGIGTVFEVTGSGDSLKVGVRFPNIGEKKFVAQHARLEILARR